MQQDIFFDYVYWCYYCRIQIFMFLNLKNKKVIDVALNNHIKASQYPKTFRQDTGQRISKESIGNQTNRNTHHQFNKKAIQNNAINNQNQTAKTKQSSQSLQNIAKSNIRGQKIANAYKKLKNYDIIDKSRRSEQSWQTQKQKNQRSTKQFPKNILNRKEAIANFTNNYIMISQNSKHQDKYEEYQQCEGMDININEILQLLLSLFNLQTSNQMQQTIGLRVKSNSSRQLQLKGSLQRNTPKLVTKKSNKNLSQRNKTSRNQHHATQDKSQNLLSIFQKKLQICQNKIQSQLKFNQNEDDKQSLLLTKKVVNQIQRFTFLLYEQLISESDGLLKKYQKSFGQICNYTKQIQHKYESLQAQIDSMRSYTSNLQAYINQMNNKNHYAAYFISEISYCFDVDSFIRQKIIQCYDQYDKSVTSSEYQKESDNNISKGSFKLKLNAKKGQFLDQFLYQQYKTADLKNRT